MVDWLKSFFKEAVRFSCDYIFEFSSISFFLFRLKCMSRIECVICSVHISVCVKIIPNTSIFKTCEEMITLQHCKNKCQFLLLSVVFHCCQIHMFTLKWQLHRNHHTHICTKCHPEKLFKFLFNALFPPFICFILDYVFCVRKRAHHFFVRIKNGSGKTNFITATIDGRLNCTNKHLDAFELHSITYML